MKYVSKYNTLKVVIKSSTKPGNGEAILFVNGFYETKDKKEIDFLSDYIKKYPGDVTEAVIENPKAKEKPKSK